MVCWLTAAGSEAVKADEAVTKEDSEASRDKPARKRKWGSAKSSGSKRTSLEISTDSLKVSVGVKCQCPILCCANSLHSLTKRVRAVFVFCFFPPPARASN